MTKIALVHDWLNQRGGAERVLEELHTLFPLAPIHTSIYWRDGMPAAYRAWDIKTTWMDYLPGIYRHQQLYFPLYAPTFAHLNLQKQGYDLILSNKSGFCHGVQAGDIPQISYCLAPTRYVWEYEAYAARESLPPWFRQSLLPVVKLLRRWDYAVAQRPTTHFIAISTAIQERIRRYYGREAEVIYPPVAVKRYHPATQHDDYYLLVSRLVPYKRIDLAVRAFNELGLPLLVVGSGRAQEVLEALAKPNIQFLGYLPDADVSGLLARCKAFVFPGREDFGIAPVEAQAAGRPVIAYGAGGALDTVLVGETGVFFSEPTPESLAAAVRTFDASAVDPLACRANAERFSVARFQQELRDAIARVLR
ncbi:MAG: glycosyltransferase [Chloroflexota bacterium]|nr:glycosyltransferase [Chloroflexota bacterium]